MNQGWIASFTLITAVLLMGYLNARDIAACEREFSTEVCLGTFNP